MLFRSLLKEQNIAFEWNIVGLNKHDATVSLFTRKADVCLDKLNIQLLGIKNASEIAKILQHSDVFVHSSYIDNSPNTVCEAQLIGTTVIASNVGGVSSLVEHRKTGILYTSNDPYNLAAEIVAESKTKTCNRVKTREMALNRHNKKTILSNLINAYSFIIRQEPTKH